MRLEPFDQGRWTQFTHHETTYPVGLIQAICQVKEFGNICDNARDEVASYVAASLRFAIFPYFGKRQTSGVSTSSTSAAAWGGVGSMWLSRMFPESEIVGVELEPHLLEIARMRRDFHRADKVTLLQSPSGDSLPPDLGTFDFVVFSALFEHLLPHEHPALLPKVWETLSPGGVLFLCETPHRYHFKESHTTNLYGLNCLPDRLTLWATRRFSKRYGADASWEFLLREGIRGGTVRDSRHPEGDRIAPRAAHPPAPRDQGPHRRLARVDKQDALQATDGPVSSEFKNFYPESFTSRR